MSEDRELGAEEKQFATLMLTGMDPAAAALASDLVPEGTSMALAKKTAMQALGDTDVKAFFIDLMEDVDLQPRHLMQTLKDGLTTDKFGINQKDGEVVNLGPDGMSRATFAKLVMQGMGLLGGGAASKPVDQNPPPAAIQVNFNVRNVREPREKEPTFIDGDDDYSVS